MNQKSNIDVSRNGQPSPPNVDLVELCDEFGTPLFVFDEERLSKNFVRFQRAFTSHYPKSVVCYSIKTNNNIAICNTMQRLGAYAEVASELDLEVALKAGFKPEHIILDGPFKSRNLLYKAFRKAIALINAESTQELDRLNHIAKDVGLKQNTGLRINFFKPRIFSSAAVYCNPSSRFGFSERDAHTILKDKLRFANLNIGGVMAHPFHDYSKLISFAEHINREFDIDVAYLNFGGGFLPETSKSVSYRELLKDYLKQRFGMKSNLDSKEPSASIEHVSSSITEAVKQANLESEPTIMLEPGRYITENAGFLLVRVDHVKEAGGYVWAIVDGGTNLLPVTSERHEIRLANRTPDGARSLVNIVGPIPAPNDYISIKSYLPKLEEGDILAVSNAGSYSLSSSNQFLYPRPNAVMLNRGKITKIRERETCEDVLRFDRIG